MRTPPVALQLPVKLKLNLLYTTALYFSASWLLSLQSDLVAFSHSVFSALVTDSVLAKPV